MSVFVATTVVDVLRGTALDVYGDERDTDTVVASRLPAAVTEQQQRSYLPSESRGGVVETYTIRLRPRADVREQDRLRTADGTTYQVQAVNSPHSVVGFADVRVTAVKTSSTSQPVNG